MDKETFADKAPHPPGKTREQLESETRVSLKNVDAKSDARVSNFCVLRQAANAFETFTGLKLVCFNKKIFSSCDTTY